jgi:hypothetical protein
VYVALWSFFQLANFGFGFTDNKKILDWHAILVSLQPLSVCSAAVVAIVLEY